MVTVSHIYGLFPKKKEKKKVTIDIVVSRVPFFISQSPRSWLNIMEIHFAV